MVKLYRSVKFAAAFVAIVAFMGCASTQKHESTGQYVDDTAITSKVKTAIFKEESLKTLQISVKTYKGVVQLSGFVDSSNKVTKAGEIAQSIDNVVSVENDLVVK